MTVRRFGMANLAMITALMAALMACNDLGLELPEMEPSDPPPRPERDPQPAVDPRPRMNRKERRAEAARSRRKVRT